MKALKVVGILFGVIFLVGFIFWASMIRTPSTNAMCKHVNKILMEENPDAPQMSEEMCAKQFAKGKREGAIPYAKKTKCLMKAKSIEDLTKCGNI